MRGNKSFKGIEGGGAERGVALRRRNARGFGVYGKARKRGSAPFTLGIRDLRILRERREQGEVGGKLVQKGEGVPH